jgi:hypothetical protein
MNARDIIDGWRDLGLECPEPRTITALIDTGSPFTVVSKIFANYCKLFQTSPDAKVKTLGGSVMCGEHAGSVTFPGTDLRPIDGLRIVSGDFLRERNFSGLIGRDILQNWYITFDGRRKFVTIED